MYLNTVLTKVFINVFVFEKFIVFVFKYYARYLDPSLMWTHISIYSTAMFALVYPVLDSVKY